MSKLKLEGNASGTGTFTIAAPNSNTDRSLALPDEAGTVLTSASDIESQVKTATNASGSAPIYSCRAWVNFNGTGTVAIRESGNVSSITDNGAGDFTINFATALPDASYSVASMATGVLDSTALQFFIKASSATGAPSNLTTTALEIVTWTGAGPVDADYNSVAIFR